MKYVKLAHDAEVRGTLRRMRDEPVLHLNDEDADPLIEAGHEDVTDEIEGSKPAKK